MRPPLTVIGRAGMPARAMAEPKNTGGRSLDDETRSEILLG
jgi:hypothetical protein